MGKSDFITAMSGALARGVEIQGMRVVIDATEEQATPIAEFLSVDFHLAGAGACTAKFTYTFSSDQTVEENLTRLADFARQQNTIASRPPGAAAAGGGTLP